MSRGNSYASISTLGNLSQAVTQSNDPLTYCMFNTYDSKFQHGSSSNRLNPYNQACQAFMEDRCSKNWDTFCDMWASSLHQTQQYPNTQQFCNQGNQIIENGITVGQSLIGNSLMRRFCTFPNCEMVTEPFDPTVANSPWITYYNTDSCIPVCSVDPKTINSDPIMNKALQPENVMSSITVLQNICNNARRNGTDLSGTRIGEFCNAYNNGQLQFPRSKSFLPGSNILY